MYSVNGLSYFLLTGGMMYWEEEGNGGSQYSEDWQPPYYSPPSQDIEISAYALLTYARRNDISSAVPVLKWLTSKRNELGAYDSTQVEMNDING